MSSGPTTLGGEPRTLSTDAVDLAGRWWPGRGEPIVALHGLSSQLAFYTGVAERLTGRRPFLALDLRGRGGSDKPADGYGMAQHADDVAAAMTTARVDRAVVVGHSMGAGVATVLAHRHPDRVAGIVLLDGGLQVFADYLNDQDRAREFLTASQPIEGRLEQIFPDRAAYRSYWAGLDVFGPTQWGPWPEAYVDYDVAEVDGGVQARCSRAAITADAVDLLQTAMALGETPLDVPVLAVHAAAGIVNGTSPLVRPAAIERMAATFRSFSSLLVPDTNHYTIALTEPAATIVADAIIDFTKRCQL